MATNRLSKFKRYGFDNRYEYITASEAAQMLKLDESTIRHHFSKGRLRGAIFKNKRYYTKESVEAFKMWYEEFSRLS